MKKTWLAALLLVSAPAAAWAQVGRNYDVKTMNFDLWCQEEAGLPSDRCDKRLPEDEKQFEAYRAVIERYEIPYLQQKRNDAILDRTLLHNDPTDASSNHDATGQVQQANPAPTVPPP